MKNKKWFLVLIPIVLICCCFFSIVADFFLGGPILGSLYKTLGLYPATPYDKVTISQGVYGKVLGKVCTSNTNCKYNMPLATKVYITGPLLENDDFNSAPVLYTATSDSTGFYQISLPVGEYSILVDYNGTKFCGDARPIISPYTLAPRPVCRVSVKEGKTEYEQVGDVQLII